jgi:chemotaxis protein CheX
MDVKFINPFLYGTAEVLEKMASVKPVTGKPFAKTDDTACGDVSGIIGMTGDAIGSLAITFNEECIIYIANKMLGENHTEMNREVRDTVGELTNMISGAARKMMEKDNLKVFAAIPTIVFGKGHTVRHIIKGPSIVIPFETDKGTFAIDICLQSQLKKEPVQPPVQQMPSTEASLSSKALSPAMPGKASAPQIGPEITQARIEQDLVATRIVDHKDAGERLVYLKQVLAEIIATRDIMIKQLKEQPLMDLTKKQRYKKALPAYDAKIKRLNLDITAAETIARMSKDQLENPTIKPHFQHYPNVSAKPGEK